MGRGRAVHPVRAHDIDVPDIERALLIELVDRREAHDAGAIHEALQAAELQRRLDRGLAALGISDVEMLQHHGRTGGRLGVRLAVQLLVDRDVAGEYGITFRRQSVDDGATDAADRAGEQDDIGHVVFP